MIETLVTIIDRNIHHLLLVAQTVLVVAIVSQLSIKKVQKEVEARKEAEATLAEQAKKLKKAKVQLQKEHNKLQAVLSHMGEGLLVCDRKGRITMINQVGGALLRVSPDAMIGTKIQSILSFFKEIDGGTEEDFPVLQKVMTEPDIITVHSTDNVFCRNRDDVVFPISCVAASLVVKNKVRGGILVFQDSTEEYNVNQMKTEFVSVASHQLRTPLTGINWYIESLLDNPNITDEQTEYVKEIQKGTGRMIKLVNELLNVSRLETGTIKIEPEPTDLSAFVAGIIEGVRLYATSLNVQVSLKKPKTAMKQIPLDKTMIQHVIQNLITNAVRYSKRDQKKKQTVEVSIIRKKQTFVISVKDNGIGISEHDQANMFRKFFRSESARKQEPGGSGLGMYISKKITEAAGGKIWFESFVGKGTTFFVEFPISGMKRKSGEKGLA